MLGDADARIPDRHRSRLPDSIRKILESKDSAPNIPPELKGGFSAFSFASRCDGDSPDGTVISPPHSPLTFSVPFECEDGISWEPLSTAQPSSASQNSASTPSSAISYLQSRRSSQESTHIELDILANDVRRIHDGMKESLDRYFCSSSFTAFYLPSAYLRFHLPSWSPLERSLTHLCTALSALLEHVQDNLGMEECYDISIQLCPKLLGLTEQGFAILKTWNQRDDNLASEGHRKFVHMDDKERKAMIKKTNEELSQLKNLSDQVEKLVRPLLAVPEETVEVSSVVSKKKSRGQEEEKAAASKRTSSTQ